jgi:hypothetical protein
MSYMPEAGPRHSDVGIAGSGIGTLLLKIAFLSPEKLHYHRELTHGNSNLTF